jgi:iron-sulfur cluster insertion protein
MAEGTTHDRLAEEQPPMVQLTPRAVQELKGLRDRGDTDSVLRLFVAGERCCGYQYGLAFESQVNQGDAVSEHDGLRLVVDEAIQPLCTGATVDYVETPQGAGFSVRTPASSGRCTCGRGGH